MASMVFLGHGKWARADRIFALEPIEDDRGDGRRTRVWVDGIAEPLVASRTERTILVDMAGPLSCPAGTIQKDVCELQLWQMVKEQYGIKEPDGAPMKSAP